MGKIPIHIDVVSTKYKATPRGVGINETQNQNGIRLCFWWWDIVIVRNDDCENEKQADGGRRDG